MDRRGAVEHNNSTGKAKTAVVRLHMHTYTYRHALWCS